MNVLDLLRSLLLSMPGLLSAGQSPDSARVPFSDGPNDPVLVEAAELYALDPALLYAVGVQESGVSWSDGVRRPSPYIIRLRSGRVVRASNVAELRMAWHQATMSGDPPEDVGPMQVNVRYHAHRVSDPLDLLDPAINVRVAAEILREQLDTSDDIAVAIGRYHHQRHPSRTLWYAGRVLETYRKVVAK